MSEIMLSMGKDKPKVAVSQADDRTLQWYAENARKADIKSAVDAELARRANGGKPAPRTEPAAPPKPAAPKENLTMSLEKAVHDPAAVTARLEELGRQFHIVAPATRVDALPPGCGIAISYVLVDTSKDAKEVYDVGGRLGLSGDTLARIGAAAGVDWDPRQCGRLDDGSDPHYCHYRAVGFVRNFDGSVRTLTGEVEIDAREGSPQIEEIRTKAQKRESDPDYKGKKDGGASQILELRKFILRHAERKAKNRAIADMGVKRSYAPAELRKPFAVARLMWTGETEDPELKREFARMHAKAMIQGTAALYGSYPEQLEGLARELRQLPAPAQSGHAPPPVGGAQYDDEPDGPEFDHETDGESAPEASSTAPSRNGENY